MSIIDITPGDILRLKKKHPCGQDQWLVLKTGIDFRIRCLGCEREVLMERQVLERKLKGTTRSVSDEPESK